MHFLGRQLVLVALCLSTPGLGQPQVPNDTPFRRHLEAGEKALRAGDPHKARSSFRKALARSPDSPEALNGLAQASLSVGDWEAAEKWANRLLDTDDASYAASARIALGSALYYQVRDTMHSEGRADYRRSRTSWKGDKLEKAAELFDTVIGSAGEEIGDLYLAFAEILQRLGRTDEARTAIDRYFSYGATPSGQKSAENLRCLLDDESLWIGDSNDLVERPRKLEGQMPKYTGEARRFRLKGTVITEAVVDETGRIRCAQILIGLPLGLSEATLEAIKAWRYEPARLNGQAISVRMRVTTTFGVW